MDEARIRRARTDDLGAITDIYNEAVVNSTATFDIEPRSADEQRRWFEQHGSRHPILVAETEGRVVGWASLNAWSDRRAYDWTGELSLYISAGFRDRGIGRGLLERLIAEAEQLGYHALLARIVAGNEASLHLAESLGFEPVGVMREVGRKFDRWLDVQVLERLVRPGSGPPLRA
jgi:phosphinothricin acetyltransferase